MYSSMNKSKRSNSSVNESDRLKRLFEFEMQSRNKDSENTLLHQKLNELYKELDNANHQSSLLQHILVDYYEFRLRQDSISNSDIDFLQGSTNQQYQEFEIKSLISNQQNLKEILSSSTVVSRQQFAQIQRFKEQVQELTRQNQQLEQKVYSLQQQNDILTIAKNEQACHSIEASHLRSDNHQLTNMLRSTQEFQSLAELGRDQGLRFLKEIYNTNSNTSKKNVDNSLYWVPEKAFHFLLDFKAKLGPESLNEIHIELILFELNKIWSQRQDDVINRIKKQQTDSQHQHKRLDRSEKKYDTVIKERQISRLQAQVQHLSKENRQLFSNRPARSNSVVGNQEQKTDSMLFKNNKLKQYTQKDTRLMDPQK